MFDFVVLDLFFSVLGWVERLQNDVFCVGWDVKPHLTQWNSCESSWTWDQSRFTAEECRLLLVDSVIRRFSKFSRIDPSVSRPEVVGGEVTKPDFSLFLLARPALRCRMTYILPLWFFFFFSTPNLGGHWTDLNQSWTHSLMTAIRKIWSRVPRTFTFSTGLGAKKTAFWDFELWPKISLLISARNLSV